MDKALLRPLVFDALRRMPQTHVHAVENEVRQKASGYERGDALLVQEVIWELLTQGILAPGKNSLNLHLPFLHVTEHGQRCLEEGTILIHDPDGYAARLRAETRDMISPLALEGSQDALAAFHRGLLRASVTLLSRAALVVLADLETGIRRLTENRSQAVSSEKLSLAARAATVRGLPPDLADEARDRVSELEAVARLAHTETGVPRSAAIDREALLGRLLLFPALCGFAYRLLSECRKPE